MGDSSEECIDWKGRCEEMDAELQDLRILYENTIEHGVAVEDELAEKNLELEKIQKRLREELDEAANYAMSILPQPLRGKDAPQSEWVFVPSTELGGDTFGYHWLDPDHFAIYLLDVCGHGVGAALMSISAMNVLRAGVLRNTDFRDPGQVLTQLNVAFPMESHNEMYFTIWYGVWQKSTGMLRYVAGGHPPALVIDREGKVESLGKPQMVIGVMPDVVYIAEETKLAPGSRLFVFSDGIYELTKPDGKMLDYTAFVALVNEMMQEEGVDLQTLVSKLKSLNGNDKFDDDFSLLELHFGDAPPKA